MQAGSEQMEMKTRLLSKFEGNMKTMCPMLLLFVVVIVLFSCAAQKTAEQIRMEELADEILNSDKPVYLAHNLWFEDPMKIEMINFKLLPMSLRAGTPIQDVSTIYYNSSPRVRFSVVGDPQVYYLYINPRYQKNSFKNLTVKGLIARTFTTIPYREFTSGLKSEEMMNIEQGTIQKGMSKRAVLMSWGYPPLHYTKSCNENRWIYWKKRNKRDYVVFDEHDRIRDASWYGVGGNAVDVIE